MILWTPTFLSVLYACVFYFCICTCSAQLSMFHMERRSRNTLIIIIIIIIKSTRLTGYTKKQEELLGKASTSHEFCPDM